MNKLVRKIKSEKADEPRTFLLSRITFAICFFVSVGLIVGGFFVPPMGVIDGSCLTAVGELLVFPALLYGFRAVELGLTVKFQKGMMTINSNRIWKQTSLCTLPSKNCAPRLRPRRKE